MENLRAILFDTFGTVVDWRSSLIEEVTAFGRARGMNADWTALVDDWRAAYVPSMNRVRRGEQTWTLLDDLHRETLERLVVKHGVEGLSEADLAHINRGWHRLRPWPDSIPALERLKRKYVIAPLSNGNVGLLVNMAKQAGLPWDMVFGSDLFGHYKPDPETYLGACRLLGLPPSQVMMCAAHNDDLQAARSHGLRTGFVLRPTEYGRKQQKDLRAEEAWDVTGADLLEVASALGA